MSMAIIGGVVGVLATGYGVYSKGRATKKSNDGLRKRGAYRTPEEVFQILNALTNKSQGDTQTRDFQTGQLDRSFSNVLGTAELLGADPNDLSGLFDQKMNGILQIGQQFHASNTEAFGKYIGALDMVSQNRAAEFNSQQDLVKDQLQAAAADKQAANQTINSGINMTVAGLSAYQTNKLYKEYLDSQKAPFNTSVGSYDSYLNSLNSVSPSGTGNVNTPLSNPLPTPSGIGTVTASGLMTQPTMATGTINTPTISSQQYDAFLQWLNTNGKLGKF